jgi:signal transduction histidine kinase
VPRPIAKEQIQMLRQRGAKVIRGTGKETGFASAADLASAVEELRVHQAELEIQNEELQEARAHAEELQRRYFRHFDLAPVGMIRLNGKGMVLEANILGAAMLRVQRVRLHSRKVVFAAHVAQASQGAFYAHLKNALASSKMESCEIRLRSPSGAETFVRMQSVGSRGADDTADLLVTLTDLTELKHAEEAIAVLNAELEGRVRDRTAQLDVAHEKLEGTIDERRGLENEILAISEREQRRIGQDLHDELCQQLASIALLGGVLAKHLQDRKLVAEAGKAENIASLLDASIVCARDVARGLQPVEMVAEGLTAALVDLAVRANREVSCRFESPAPVSIANHAIALNFYRIAQEAVTNALKHAHATEIVISLDYKKSLLVLSISDNGIGLPDRPPDVKSMGCHIMAYRAEVIGATLGFEKRPGGGTQVLCSVSTNRPINGSAIQKSDPKKTGFHRR